ncbi:MAG: hypothetical protein ACWA41_01580 [Putridiphycobacter sp.]
MEATITNITPLIKKETQQGMHYIVEFQAANQLNPIQGYGTIPIDQDAMMSGVKKQMVKSAVKGSILSMLTRFISGLIGGRVGREVGYASSTIASAATQKSTQMNPLGNTKMTDGQKNEVILLAFKSVKNYFKWDAEQSQWIGVSNDN